MRMTISRAVILTASSNVSAISSSPAQLVQMSAICEFYCALLDSRYVNAYKNFEGLSLLSTLINTETPIPTKPLDGSSITFSELIERLNSQSTPPALEELNS